MSPRLLLGWVVAAAVACAADSVAAQEPANPPKPLKPGEECSVPDSPATVARRELQKRTETYVGLTAMTIDNALHDVDRYWRGREEALLERLAAVTTPLPEAAAEALGGAHLDGDQVMDLYYLQRLEGIADSCRILSGSDPAACDRYWKGSAADICRGWLAIRDVPTGDVAVCAAVAEEFRPFCGFRVKRPEQSCANTDGLVAEACGGLVQARARDWSAGCQALEPNECIGLLSALSFFEGEAACNRLPVNPPANLALRRAPPDPTRDTCLAVVRGDPTLCPVPIYPDMHAKPSVVAEVLSGREGAHLIIAATSHSPALCRVVSVIRQAGTVAAVETEMLRTDNAHRIRARRPLRPEIDPFEAEVTVESLCVSALSWGTVEEPMADQHD